MVERLPFLGTSVLASLESLWILISRVFFCFVLFFYHFLPTPMGGMQCFVELLPLPQVSMQRASSRGMLKRNCFVENNLKVSQGS